MLFRALVATASVMGSGVAYTPLHMVLRSFERRLEQMVEGSFARAFKSAVQPIELGRRLVRSMDEGRTVGVDGRAVAPNRFLIMLSEQDEARFAQMSEALCNELVGLARQHARERELGFVGAVTVVLISDPKRREGRFEVVGSYDTTRGLPANLVLADDSRIALGERFVIGRVAECDLAINDPRVSRQHAEIVRADRHVLVDLESTNGTRVNASPIRRHELVDGDLIEIGGYTMRFEAY